MQNERKIHLVPRTEAQPAPTSRVVVVRRTKQLKRKPAVLDVKDIVRETLAIARDCREVLAANPISKDQLLIDLVASLALARARKAGAR
jgi:hypothetical protein